MLQAFRNLPSNIPERSPDLATVLSSAERKFHKLDALICYTLTKAGSSDRVDRVQWILKRLEVGKLRGQMSEIQVTLKTLVNTTSS